MTSLFLAEDGSGAAYLERADLGVGQNEKWLQKVLFDNPRLLPLDRIELGAGEFIPLCRELPLPKLGGQVFLDILGITRQGHLVLVECKLWRNPQARREVVAQIIEYAALLRRWSHSDLTARLNSRLGKTGPNPIYELASPHLAGVSEADFGDAVSRSLRNGDFHLIIAADGIREDMNAIGEHLIGQGARLALVEFQIWQGANGQRVLVPHIPFRTEVLRQRIITDMEGVPVLLESESVIVSPLENVSAATADQVAIRNANRVFWQTYIDSAAFDHPDQPAPRHGGNNWVKITMPWPAKHMTAYRYEGGIGFSLSVNDPATVIVALETDAESIREETGLPDLRFHELGAPDVKGTVGLRRSANEFSGEGDQIKWLVDIGNRLVNALRPRLVAIGNEMKS